MNQRFYAREEPALPPKEQQKKQPTYFREIPNPISGSFAFLSKQISDLAMQGGDSAFLFCSKMCGDPGT